MSLVQRFSLAPGFNPDRVVPAVNSDYFALPTTRTTVGVWSFDKLEHRHKPLELQGHRRSISALAFGNSCGSGLLCSCADDYVIVWDIPKCQRHFDERKSIRGEIIATTIGETIHCSFSADDTLVAVCVDIDVHILKSDSQTTVALLDGHLSRVIGAEFCPHYSSTVVSISEDGTFKIWDLENKTLVYQSCVITSFSLVSLCMNWADPTFSVGSSDGVVRTYDLTDGNDFRKLHQVDIEGIVRKMNSTKTLQNATKPKDSKTISSRATWNKTEKFIPQMEYKNEGGESYCGIVGLWYAYSNTQTNADADKPEFLRNAVTDVISNRPTILMVSITSGLLQIDPKTLETLEYVDLTESIRSEGNFASNSVIINALNYACLSYGKNIGDVWIVAGTLFENRIHVLDWTLSETMCHDEETVENLDTAMDLLSLNPDLNPDRDMRSKTMELCFIAVNPLRENSILNSRLEPLSKTKVNPLMRRKQMSLSSTNRRNSYSNHTTTFKNKIKSSGYAQQGPKAKFFQPNVGKPKQTTLMKRSTSCDPVLLVQEYPTKCGPPDVLVHQESLSETPTPILSLRFSGNGNHLACSLANKLAMTFSMPLKKAGSVFQGHDAAVNSMDWSHDNKFLLTSSDDRSVILWNAASEPIMKMATINNNFSFLESETTNKNNPSFSKEIRQAQFYYMDKFILLISGNTFYMYKYFLDQTKDDIKRYLTKSKYKLVKSWATESQSLTALAAMNSFYSYVAICAGSNRSFEVFDLNEGRSVTVVEDAHARPIHAVSLNGGSNYVSQPSSAYNVFATTAVSDCIRLWDIRTKRCVQRFEGHQNKALQCGIAISPCGQYLASGSEDKLTYIFDIRTGTYCERLRGHTDVVSTVCYHPAKPILASGSINGSVCLFKPERWKR
ncbi:hypothetical protein LOTGIDRAFT_169443 [Lottia gigantea]|uniref:Anaphase-promoting complex subunit 4 WD40 domain-containing protein n=1 Tax=Lottia gigantea TaxID=225164 RepID=V4B4M8_LOTGI|nr:hypothetical protein LOTGIDRAFT_169443 [Lottia gigantea]ESO83374.1 hypothetical protein LOTGIDRAFT_169443 [Lottia gigantea]